MKPRANLNLPFLQRCLFQFLIDRYVDFSYVKKVRRFYLRENGTVSQVSREEEHFQIYRDN